MTDSPCTEKMAPITRAHRLTKHVHTSTKFRQCSKHQPSSSSVPSTSMAIFRSSASVSFVSSTSRACLSSHTRHQSFTCQRIKMATETPASQTKYKKQGPGKHGNPSRACFSKVPGYINTFNLYVWSGRYKVGLAQADLLLAPEADSRRP